MGGHSTTKFVGLDVHSKSISIAIADEGCDGEVRHYGTSTEAGMGGSSVEFVQTFTVLLSTLSPEGIFVPHSLAIFLIRQRHN